VTREHEAGSVVIIALLFAGIVVALGLSLVTMATTERAVAGNYQTSTQALYGAEALARFVVTDLDGRTDWNGVLSGSDRSAFSEASLHPVTSWRASLNLPALTTGLQNDSSPPGTWGADTPAWQLFAWGTFSALTGRGDAAPLYLVAWVADDPADGDGNPYADSNGLVTLRVDAVGQGGLKRRIQAVVKRPEPDSSVSGVLPPPLPAVEQVAADVMARNLPSSSGGPSSGTRLLSWREVR